MCQYKLFQNVCYGRTGSKMFNNMTVVELKEYLHDRGVSVNGYLKPASVEIAIAVEKMMLPSDPNFGKDQNRGQSGIGY